MQISDYRQPIHCLSHRIWHQKTHLKLFMTDLQDQYLHHHLLQGLENRLQELCCFLARHPLQERSPSPVPDLVNFKRENTGLLWSMVQSNRITQINLSETGAKTGPGYVYIMLHKHIVFTVNHEKRLKIKNLQI